MEECEKSSGSFCGAFFETAKRFGVALCIVVATGFVSNILFEKSAWSYVRRSMPEVNVDSLSSAAGTGVVLGTVGGFRTVLADIAWMRVYTFWSDGNLRECEAMMGVARTLDPQNYFFWENSLNYIAYDFPNWIVRKRGGPFRVPEKVQEEIHRRALVQALEFVEREAKQFPDDGKIWAHAGQIVILKTDRVYGESDFNLALKYYKRAMECRTQPWFVFLVYANLVRTHVPSEKEDARAYFKTRLAGTTNATLRSILEEAVVLLDAAE